MIRYDHRHPEVSKSDHTRLMPRQLSFTPTLNVCVNVENVFYYNFPHEYT
jgi:hypothetical protein